MVDLKQVMSGETPNQNLINQSKYSSTIKEPGFYKSIVLDVFSVLSAALFGFSYYRYLEYGLGVWWLLGALAFWGAISTLQVFLAKQMMRRILLLVLESLVPLILFYHDHLAILITTAAVLFVFLVWGYTASRSVLMNGVEIQFFRVTSNVLGKLTTAALLFMILIYVPQVNQGSVFVSSQSFREFFDWSSGVLTNIYPNITIGGSFQNFAEGVAAMELKENPNFQTLSPQTQSSTISQAASQFETNFGTTASGATVAPDAPASDAFYNFIVGMLQAWQSEGSIWFIVGWAAVLFLALRTLGILFVWIDQFIALIFYEILLASGFMKITEATQTKELINF